MMPETDEEGPVGEVFDQTQFYAERILHVLTVYPRISPTMVQVGIGTSTPSKVWKPVLDRLVAKGYVKQETVTSRTPSGRVQTHQVISLTQQALDIAGEDSIRNMAAEL